MESRVRASGVCACAPAVEDFTIMSKRPRTSEGCSESCPDHLIHKTGRRFCPHCMESLSLKTFLVHRRLYYNQVVCNIIANTIGNSNVYLF